MGSAGLARLTASVFCQLYCDHGWLQPSSFCTSGVPPDPVSCTPAKCSGWICISCAQRTSESLVGGCAYKLIPPGPSAPGGQCKRGGRRPSARQHADTALSPVG